MNNHFFTLEELERFFNSKHSIDFTFFYINDIEYSLYDVIDNNLIIFKDDNNHFIHIITDNNHENYKVLKKS